MRNPNISNENDPQLREALLDSIKNDISRENALEKSMMSTSSKNKDVDKTLEDITDISKKLMDIEDNKKQEFKL